MTNLRILSLIFAVILTVMIIIFIGLAIFDSTILSINWRSTIAQFQTFLGGLSVLAASLFAYHANTAMADEVRKKNEADNEKLRRNLLAKASLTFEMIRQQTHVRLCDLQNYSNNFQNKQISIIHYEKLHLTIPNQLDDLWDHLDFLPEKSYPELAKITNYMQIYLTEHHMNIQIDTKIDNIFQEARQKIIDSTKNNKITGSDNLNIASNNLKKFLIIQNKYSRNRYMINWYRAASILEELNESTLNIMKILPLSRNWTHERAPRPTKKTNQGAS